MLALELEDDSDFKIAKLLISRGANVNAEYSLLDLDGTEIKSPILRTFADDDYLRRVYPNVEEKRRIQIINFLLDHKADINSQDNDVPYNLTPLMTALHDKNERLASLLVERGADILFENKAGQTAFSILCNKLFN